MGRWKYGSPSPVVDGLEDVRERGIARGLWRRDTRHEGKIAEKRRQVCHQPGRRANFVLTRYWTGRRTCEVRASSRSFVPRRIRAGAVPLRRIQLAGAEIYRKI